MRQFTATLALAAALFFAGSQPSQASSVTLFGSSFSITNLGLVDAGDPDGAYKFQLDLNSAGYVPPTQNPKLTTSGTDYLTAFAISFGTDVIDASVSMVSPASGWTFSSGQLNNSCENGPNSVTCFSTALTTTLMNGGLYQWIFTVDFLGDGNYAPPQSLGIEVQVSGLRAKSTTDTFTRDIFNTSGSFRAPYTPPQPPGDTAPVPEPGSLLLLGSGLALVARRLRRKSS